MPAVRPHILRMEQPQPPIDEPFDFSAQAEVYASLGRGASRRPMSYRRFTTGSEAIRYVMENLAPEMRIGTVVQSGAGRFDAKAIRTLYDSSAYPLTRSGTA